MNLIIYTGRKAAANNPPQFSVFGPARMPILFNPSTDPDEWTLCDGEEPIDGPHCFEGDWAEAMRQALRKATLTGEMQVAFQGQQRPMPRSLTGSGPLVPVSESPPSTLKPLTDPPTPLTLDQITKKIVGIQRRTVENFLDIGQWLTEAKKFVGHGNWLDYLEKSVDISERYARVFMRIYEKYGSNRQSIADLSITKIGLLLEAPEEAQSGLIEAAKTQPVRVLRRAVRLVRRSVMPTAEAISMAIAQSAPGSKRKSGVAEDASSTTKAHSLAPEVHAESETATAAQPEAAPIEPGKTLPPAEPATQPAPAPPQPSPPAEPHRREPDPPPAQPEPAPALAVIVNPVPIDPHQEHKEKALAVNMAIRAFLDTAASNRSPIDTAQGKEFGDWIDLKALYEADKTLEEVQDALRRLAADCYRPC